MAAIEAERRGRSGSIQKPPRSLQAEMECEESGSSLGEQEDLRAEVTRACKRLRELCSRLRRGEDDSGLQSDCDESMLVIANGAEAEVGSSQTFILYPLYPFSSSRIVSSGRISVDPFTSQVWVVDAI